MRQYLRFLLLLALGVTGGLYCLASLMHRSNKPTAPAAMQRAVSDKTRRISRDKDAAISELISEGRHSKLARHAVERKCTMYSEFRNPAFRRTLCSNALAYKMYSDGYPMCLLPNPFPAAMLDVVRQSTEIRALKCMNNVTLQIYIYKGNDHISNVIRKSSSWEPEMVHWTLKFAMKMNNVTFLDMGSNMGVYSIQAARLGLPVVAVDANIRNLLRLRLSLDAASLEAALVWNFIADDQQLKYLGFLADCNVGGAGRDKAQLPDTIPVMPLRSERLASLIKTSHIVLKMDIQGGEIDFLKTVGRLFEDFTVALVQMEWQKDMIRGKDSLIMVDFFVRKGYRVWQAGSMKPLDPKKSKTWGVIDIVWVHRNYNVTL